MTPPVIETPRGKVFATATGKAELKWSTDFKPKWQEHFTAAQKFVDSEVIRLCEPYIPLDTSMLIKSGILGSTPGEGFVHWLAPYAAAQYYSPRAPGSQTGPLRGPFWFERMRAVSGNTIIAGARKLAGGGA